MLIIAQGAEQMALENNPAMLRDSMEFCRYLSRTPMDPKMGPIVAAPVFAHQTMPARGRGLHENDPNWTFVPAVDGQVQMQFGSTVNMAAPGAMDKFIDEDHKALCMYIYCRDKTESVIKPLMQRIREYITHAVPLRHPPER